MANFRWIRRAQIFIRDMKLHHKFTASYLLVCLIPLLIVSAIIYNRSAASLEDSSLEFASLYTSQIETSTNQFIDEYDRITKSVLVDGDIISRLDIEDKLPMDELIIHKMTIQRALMRVAVLKPEIGSLMLVTSHNVHQYSTSNSTVNESRLQNQDWYKAIHDSEDKFFITAAHDRSYYEDRGEGAVFTVGRVLLNADGSYAGVLLLDLDPFQLLQLNQNFVVARDRYDMRVIISTQAGGIVYHSDAVSGKRAWKEILDPQADLTLRHDDNLIVLNGSSPGTKLTVKTEIPRDKLLLKISKMKYLTSFVIVVCALFVVFVSMGLSYTITKPIKNLRRSMKLAETGQYIPIEKRSANDELGSLVNSYNKMIVTIKSLIENVYIADIKQRQAKFLALQNQINPHMLYNTLESIRMKALVNEQDEIAGMIKILARMFRLALGKDVHLNRVRHEVEYAGNYLQLQNIRFGNSFTLECQLGEEVLESAIIPLVFQPIVENSINHGFVDYSQQMHIRIEGSLTPERNILIRVKDDGAGMPREKVEEINALLLDAETDKLKLDDSAERPDKGIGLKNIAERIKLHYGDSYYLSVSSRLGEGTTVELLISAQQGDKGQ